MAVNTKNAGFITLIAVIIVGDIGVAVVTSVILLGLGSSRTSFANDQSNQAKGLADACAEEALEQIHNLISYTSGGNLSLGQGSCTYTITAGAGEARTISATGTVGTISRKVSVSITQILPTIIVSSWQEVADF